MAKYNADEARALLIQVQDKLKPASDEEVVEAAQALLEEFEELASKHGLSVTKSGTNAWTVNVRYKAIEIVYLRDGAIVTSFEKGRPKPLNLRFNRLAGLLEGTEDEKLPGPPSYSKPKRSALAVLVERVIHELGLSGPPET